MSLAKLFILSISLSMDAFAVSVCKGLSLGKIRPKHMAVAGAWFGGFQALMPVIGFFLGRYFADAVNKYSHWIAFFLLLFIGGNMIRESFSDEENAEEKSADMGVKTMFLMAVATSIDALTVGVMFAFLKVNIIAAAVMIGITTFVFSAAGVKIGSVFGTKYKSKAEVCGGVILILLGLQTLLEGLGVL